MRQRSSAALLLVGLPAAWLSFNITAWDFGVISEVARAELRTSRRALHSSQFEGVSWHDRYERWQAQVVEPEEGVSLSLGLFASEQDAAKAYDCGLLALKASEAPVNFPAKKYKQCDIDHVADELEDVWFPRQSARFMGVYRTLTSTKWRAELEIYNVKQFLGSFDDEEEAARAVDAAIRSTGAEKALQLRMLNFCTDADYFEEDSWEEEAVPRGASSRFMGVTYHQPSGQFLARFGRRHLGLYDEEDDAARAFDKASHERGGRTNFHPSTIGA
ncbi:AP2-4 [Symbiodinium microadriaticum]|nr:AP2-4 [Symbiodinium sp. KB8]CAE7902884.1 AP2-4 [Symbiodinium microadriaticum]